MVAIPKPGLKTKPNSDLIEPLKNEERIEIQSWTISQDALVIPTKVKKKGDIAGVVLERLLRDYGAIKTGNKLTFEGVTANDLAIAVNGLSTWNCSFVFPHEHNRCSSSVGIQAMILEDARRRSKYPRILEPSAGSGELAHILKERAVALDCVELNERRCSELVKLDLGTITHGDFMTVPVRETYDLIVMYPPLWAAAEHYMKAMLHLKKGGRLIGVLPAQTIFDKTPAANKLRAMTNVTRRIVGIEHSCVGRKHVPLHVVTFG